VAAPVVSPTVAAKPADDESRGSHEAREQVTQSPQNDRSKPAQHHSRGHAEPSRPAKPAAKPGAAPRAEPADGTAYDPDSLFLGNKP
jgi:hypothetical protein